MTRATRATRASRATRVAVFGAGSWGTAFGAVLADAGADVTLWGRRAQVCAAIDERHENPDYLPGVALPPRLAATPDPAAALAGAQVVVLALPAQSLRACLAGWTPMLPRDCVLVSLMKGVELGTARRMSEVVAQVTGTPPERIAVISGPNLSREIVARQPSASVVACVDEAVAVRLQQSCHTAYFRPYTNTDVTGVELGGAVKNVIALAVGMAEGMGFGDNSKASIVTRGLAETSRLGLALGADPRTFSGLAGLGDLVATCASPLSRNRTLGVYLGSGVALADAVARTRTTAEGVRTAEAILQLAGAHGIDMPITEHVVSVVRDGVAPREVVGSLMGRVAKAEHAG